MAAGLWQSPLLFILPAALKPEPRLKGLAIQAGRTPTLRHVPTAARHSWCHVLSRQPLPQLFLTCRACRWLRTLRPSWWPGACGPFLLKQLPAPAACELSTCRRPVCWAAATASWLRLRLGGALSSGEGTSPSLGWSLNFMALWKAGGKGSQIGCWGMRAATAATCPWCRQPSPCGACARPVAVGKGRFGEASAAPAGAWSTCMQVSALQIVAVMLHPRLVTSKLFLFSLSSYHSLLSCFAQV